MLKILGIILSSYLLIVLIGMVISGLRVWSLLKQLDGKQRLLGEIMLKAEEFEISRTEFMKLNAKAKKEVLES